MTRVYRTSSDGLTKPLDRIACKSETVELQDLLNRNYDLLPGDQIDPDDPCRWMLIKREMPVLDRWSVDFFFVDHNATPTFVECKRSDDTDARRKVVGQMLDYAANGHRYWTRDVLRTEADATAAAQGSTIEEAVARLLGRAEGGVDEFFEAVEANLLKRQIRVIFFLEDSSFELQSIVEFLNEQTKESEILLVEARQYRLGEQDRIVVPTLFGFTERARMAKRSAAAGKSGSRQVWDEDKFFVHAYESLDSGATALRELLQSARDLACEVSWGTGSKTGSYNVKVPALGKPSLLSVYSDGNISFNFWWFHGSDRTNEIRKRYIDLVTDRLEVPAREKQDNLPLVGPAVWMPKKAALVGVLDQLISEFPA